jgi:predicted phosphoribosyltransferase/predicted alpha/beta-hydrolase family hydrolase
MRFSNREEAGEKLAAVLKKMRFNDPIVIALPRGGLPVAAKVAEALHSPLDILIVRKIGAPDNPEYGIGAITEDGPYWLNQDAVTSLGITDEQLQEILNREMMELSSRVHRFRGNRPLTSVEEREVILVDDGLATGVTARVAIEYLKELGAGKIILAIPTCAKKSAQSLREIAHSVLCLEESDDFLSVGLWYEDFSQLSDDEVISILMSHVWNKNTVSTIPLRVSKEVKIMDSGSIYLSGQLNIPTVCNGIVIFAHGSGSGRLSPRNIQVAHYLNTVGLGTLLFDLLTVEESKDRTNIFDVPFLSKRLILATKWVLNQKAYQQLPIGYFGASTGAAAALWAAADMKSKIAAVVSRGGRPDLAIPKLKDVQSPTLLMVGSSDEHVIELNQEASQYLLKKKLIIVPGATHLFEEPGTLELVSKNAGNWFKDYFSDFNKQVKSFKKIA